MLKENKNILNILSNTQSSGQKPTRHTQAAGNSKITIRKNRATSRSSAAAKTSRRNTSSRRSVDSTRSIREAT
jgi:hypothetical protein